MGVWDTSTTERTGRDGRPGEIEPEGRDDFSNDLSPKESTRDWANVDWEESNPARIKLAKRMMKVVKFLNVGIDEEGIILSKSRQIFFQKIFTNFSNDSSNDSSKDSQKIFKMIFQTIFKKFSNDSAKFSQMILQKILQTSVNDFAKDFAKVSSKDSQSFQKIFKRFSKNDLQNFQRILGSFRHWDCGLEGDPLA